MRYHQAKILLLVVACHFICTQAGAQKRNNVWLFGRKSGIDFNANPAAPSLQNPVNLQFPYPLTSISDTTGQLVFYSDGFSVWNVYNKKVDHKYNNWPWGGYTMPLLLPAIGNDSLYYLFGVSNSGPWAKTLSYLLLDKNAGAGRGAIVYPQPSTMTNYFKRLTTGVLPMVAGTGHCNRRDTWVVTYGENRLYSYLVTAAGVDSVPVVSALPEGTPVPDTVIRYNMKFSANGEKLVLPLIDKNQFLVLEFNNATGRFSKPLRMTMPPDETLEDLELSPDGSKLYYGSYVIDPESYIELHNVFQVNLDAGDEAAIRNSAMMISPFPDRAGCTPHTCFYVYRTIQLAPDGKIYVSMRDNFPYASVIEEPNEAGTQVRYMYAGMNMKTTYGHMSFNYVRSSSYSASENGIQARKSNCADLPVSFSLLFNKADSVSWDFGDHASGDSNYSNNLEPSHRFSAPGTYKVKAIIHHPCFSDTAESLVQIRNDVAVKLPETIRDTTLCTGNVFTFDASSRNANRYIWFVDGYLTYEPRKQVTGEGVYDVTVRNDCSVDRKVFRVKYEKCDCQVFVPTAFTPNNDGLNDVFMPATRCFVQQYRFVVCNRFGQIVFNTTDPQKGWDGSIAPYTQASGVFAWMVQYKDPNSGKMISQKGTVTLLR